VTGVYNGYYEVIAIPVINGLVEIAKKAGLSKRYCPVLAVSLGVLLRLGVRAPGEPVGVAVLDGLVVGLSAVGLYSGGRSVLRRNSKYL